MTRLASFLALGMGGSAATQNAAVSGQPCPATSQELGFALI